MRSLEGRPPRDTSDRNRGDSASDMNQKLRAARMKPSAEFKRIETPEDGREQGKNQVMERQVPTARAATVVTDDSTGSAAADNDADTDG